MDKIRLKPIEIEHEISKEYFKKNYLKANKPVILKDFSRNWDALDKWDYEYLKKGCGQVEVPLYDEAFANSDNDYLQESKKMKFGEYLNLIENKPTKLRMFLFNVIKYMPYLKNDFSFPDLGVKYIKSHPFLFVGGRDAYVDIHYDLDHSHVFLTQIKGKKKVILYSNEDSKNLYQHPFTVSCNIDFRDPDLNRYPKLKNLQGFTHTLEPGETIFIPSCWWHYIEYSTDGISLTLRAMPGGIMAKAKGLISIFKLKIIDHYVGKLLGSKKWYDIKEKWAHNRAQQGS